MVQPQARASQVLNSSQRVIPAVGARVRGGWRRLRLRLARVTPERWFLALFLVLLLVFSVVVLFQPTVGRGGR